ncbi:MAG TPA: response regulator [Flavisolibacter sp.]|jgi:CheY-like chemotaxis protein|nr:response regulator [Flavisolibacter sp.]
MQDGLPFRILVVEDDEDDRIFIDEAFMHIGYGAEVKKFRDGKMLLDYLAQVKPAQYPSLIVLDNHLPGWDAADMLHILKNHTAYRNVRIVVYSTMLTPALKEKLVSAGAYACMEKGNSFEALVQLAMALKNLSEECIRER